MAKKNNTKQKSMEETLWDSANKLRGTVESSEYKHVVLGLIFLKFASDKFEERRQNLVEEHKEQFMERVEFYAVKNVFYLPEESRWSYIMENAKQDDIRTWQAHLSQGSCAEPSHCYCHIRPPGSSCGPARFASRLG